MFYSPLVFKHCYSVFLSSFLVNIKLVLYIVHVLMVEGPGGGRAQVMIWGWGRNWCCSAGHWRTGWFSCEEHCVHLFCDLRS